MMRRIIAYLLVAVLLICPLFCLTENLGQSAQAADAPQSAPACCCHDNQNPPRGEAPRPADENDPDCLCHGAIIDGVRPTAVDSAPPIAIGWLINDAALSSSQLRLAAIPWEPPHQFPPFSSGRDICALVCVLLI